MDSGACEWPAAIVARESILADLESSNYSTSSSWYPVLEETTAVRELFVPAPHKGLVAVFQNATPRDALDAWVAGGYQLPLQMPNGSILVKNTMSVPAEGEVEMLLARTVMVKDTSLDASDYPGRWFYIKATPEFEVFGDCENGAYVAGAPDGCVNCHNGSSNFGIFPSIGDPDVASGAGTDKLVPYDMLNAAYCMDPDTTECSL